MSEEKKQWFELWFDSPLYHILYKNRNQEEANQFIDNVVKSNASSEKWTDYTV